MCPARACVGVWACVREQVGQALLALFAQQYVHLDLKWDNVVVRGGATAADPPLAVVRDLVAPCRGCACVAVDEYCGRACVALCSCPRVCVWPNA